MGSQARSKGSGASAAASLLSFPIPSVRMGGGFADGLDSPPGPAAPVLAIAALEIRGYALVHDAEPTRNRYLKVVAVGVVATMRESIVISGSAVNSGSACASGVRRRFPSGGGTCAGSSERPSVMVANPAPSWRKNLRQ